MISSKYSRPHKAATQAGKTATMGPEIDSDNFSVAK